MRKNFHQSAHHHPTTRERLHALLDVLGYFYRVYGKPTRAREYLRLLVSLRPSDTRLLRALAQAEFESGNPEAAQVLLEKSLSMVLSRQERAITDLMLSRVFLRLHRQEESLRSANSFKKEVPFLLSQVEAQRSQQSR